jgi:hypothetical protein
MLVRKDELYSSRRAPIPRTGERPRECRDGTALNFLARAAAGKRLLLGGKQRQFLTTKVVPPRTTGLIGRRRLLTIASQLPAKRLTVIKAPTGFGKTSLAASWSEWPRFY